MGQSVGRRLGGRRGLVAAAAALAAAWAPARADAALTPAAGWSVSTFASGFPAGYEGPTGIAADASDNVYVADAPAGLLYGFGPGGGSAAAGQRSTAPYGHWPLGLAFGKDGELYAVLEGDNEVVQLDPATGAVLRQVAAVGQPLGLATDPLSGDLMVTSNVDGGVDRIEGPSGPSPAVVPYAIGMTAPDGITAAPDGTFYVSDAGNIDTVAAIASASPGAVRAIAQVPGADGVALAANPADPAAPPFAVVNGNDGTLTELSLGSGPPSATALFTGGSRGDLVTVGPDGCLYATQVSSVVKVSQASGACPFAPVSPFQPPATAAAPAVGVAATAATLQASVNPEGAPTTVFFQYGTSTAYGASTAPAPTGAGTQPQTVDASLSGLTPSTAYHYRLVAQSQAGTAYGPDTVLTTAPPPTGPPAPQPPSNTVAPGVSGRPVPGSTLDCDPGTWSGASTLAVTWLRDGAPAGGGPTHAVARGDVGHRLSCLVTANGPGGTAEAESAALLIAAPPPALFTIRLHVRGAATLLTGRGVVLSIRVPRPCRVTVTLYLLALRHGRPTLQALGVWHVRFRHRGLRNLTLRVSARRVRRLGHGRFRVSATAVAAAARSHPASVTLAGSR